MSSIVSLFLEEDIHIKKRPLSQSSLRWLSGLVNQVKSTRQPTFTKVVVNERPIHSHIPREIQESIHIMKQPTYCFTTTIYHSTITIFIKGKGYESALDFIGQWYSFIIPFSKPQCNQSFIVTLYWTPDKKTFPTSKKILDQINVNSAFTFSCSGNNIGNEIIIFRKEEWKKVLIHESFHLLGLDFSGIKETISTPILKTMFRNVEIDDFRLYECYCELWAELLNIVFLPVNIRNAIQLETEFSIIQWKKILTYYGITYEQLIQTAKYRENTQIISYYGLKSVAWFYLNDYIEMFVIGRTNPFQFQPTMIEQYVHFFKERYRTREYIDVMEQMKAPKNSALKKTLRISLFG